MRLGSGRLASLARAAALAAAVVTCSSPPAATLGAAPDRFFASGEARLRFREAGRGEAVVLLHGLTRSLEDWMGVGDSLARTHRVIALDLRGFGQSTRFGEPRFFGTAMADDVVRLLDHLGIARAHLVGHSLGASIAARVAASHPERVRSISLLAGGFNPDPAAFARDDAGFAADVERGDGIRRLIRFLFPEMPDSMVTAINAQTMATNDAATIAAVMRSSDALAVPPDSAAAFTTPALVTAGTGDPLLGASRWLASWWPGARLLEVPNADHVTIAGRPEVLAAIRELLGGFAGVQARGEVAMGVDQYTSRHVFTPLPDGGRIELQRDTADSAGAAQIRAHMQTIKSAFAAGDFRLPGFVHDREVPGTAVMAARRTAIVYAVESLPRGGALRLTTADPAAVRAIHEFLAFQRHDHRAGEH